MVSGKRNLRKNKLHQTKRTTLEKESCVLLEGRKLGMNLLSSPAHDYLTSMRVCQQVEFTYIEKCGWNTVDFGPSVFGDLNPRERDKSRIWATTSEDRLCGNGKLPAFFFTYIFLLKSHLLYFAALHKAWWIISKILTWRRRLNGDTLAISGILCGAFWWVGIFWCTRYYCWFLLVLFWHETGTDESWALMNLHV